MVDPWLIDGWLVEKIAGGAKGMVPRGTSAEPMICCIYRERAAAAGGRRAVHCN